MRINLCGIPGAGKSRIASLLGEKLGWKVLSIDRLRNRHRDEMLAWLGLRMLLEKNTDCIVETSGINRRLSAIRKDDKGAWRDILISCQRSRALRRIERRKKAKTYFPYEITYEEFVEMAQRSFKKMKFDFRINSERVSPKVAADRIIRKFALVPKKRS